MNEKLEQAKKEIVKEYGYESFESFDDNSTFWYDQRTPEIINKVAERYHELMDEWISVDERLPECYSNDSINCLVKCDYGIVVRPFDKFHNCWNTEDDDDYYTEAKGGNVTHWKPLPQPPKQ